VKLANLEGTPEEIKNFFQDNGLKAENFFEPAELPIRTRWLVAPGVLTFIALAVLTLLQSATTQQRTFLFVVVCFFGIWWSVVLQLRFKNVWATGIVAVGCLLLALVALGVVTPVQMLEEVKGLKK
jgi:hypothetical protein